MAKILWNSKELPLRYFWVPEGEEVFEGSYSIENGDGEVFAVDLESLIPFEIESAEAEALMLQDLENMTKELGGLFKGLFKLGSRMIQSDTVDEESEDWDDESEDGDWDEKDLANILSLLEEESEEESSSDDETIEDLLNQFTEGLGSALEELGGTLAKELESLGTELDSMGSEAANALDDNPEASQDVLRELGQWLINIADGVPPEEEELDEEDMVVMQFRPKDPPVEVVDSVEDVVQGEDTLVETQEQDNDTIVENSAIPSPAALKRLTKAKL